MNDLKIRKPTIYVNSIVIVLALISNCNILFFIAFILWINIFLYSVYDLAYRSMLFTFMISIFTFLIGRDMLEEFFHYNVEDFSNKVLNHTYLSLIFTQISVFLGYTFFEKHGFNSNIQTKSVVVNENYNVKDASKLIYYVTIFFAIISKVTVAKFVAQNGYADYYTDYSDYLNGNPVLYLLSKIETMMPMALCIFAGSMPKKSEFKRPCLLYLLYLVVSLGSGQRSTFILGVLFLIVYFFYRNGNNPEEKWVKKEYYRIAFISIPMLAVFFSLYSYWRFKDDSTNITIEDALLSFIYDQGVSSNIIKRAFMYRYEIPKQIYTLEFLHSGIFARLLGITVYHGNTVEHALLGGSFTHSLGYVVMGNMYLSGRGTGSSYIAELFFDFGYYGVCLSTPKCTKR